MTAAEQAVFERNRKRALQAALLRAVVPVETPTRPDQCRHGWAEAAEQTCRGVRTHEALRDEVCAYCDAARAVVADGPSRGKTFYYSEDGMSFAEDEADCARRREQSDRRRERDAEVTS